MPGATSVQSWTYSSTVVLGTTMNPNAASYPLAYQNAGLAYFPLTTAAPKAYMYTVMSGLSTSASYIVTFYAISKYNTYFPPDELTRQPL
eukprot:54807-Eustigmatos_ZCMA.PRE.1